MDKLIIYVSHPICSCCCWVLSLLSVVAGWRCCAVVADVAAGVFMWCCYEMWLHIAMQSRSTRIHKDRHSHFNFTYL